MLVLLAVDLFSGNNDDFFYIHVFSWQGLHLDKLLFENEVIRIIPLEGDIWPNSSFDVKIFFNPKSPVQYSCTAFCEITGRQSRLPLRIRGEGLGPKVCGTWS